MTDLPPPPSTSALPSEIVEATIIETATGQTLRRIACPRAMLALQVAAGETLVEQLIPVGKRWNGGAIVDDTVPPAPDDGFEFDPVAFRWVTRAEKNFPTLELVRRLEAAQMRCTREILLGRDTDGSALATLTQIDNAIIALRARLL